MEDHRSGEFEHRYGDRVHLHSDPYVLALLARISVADTRPPILLNLVRNGYRILLARAVAAEFPTVETTVDTRMKASTDRGRWSGRTLDPGTQVVVANVMRAGNVPSLVCYEELGSVFDPEQVRIDHFYFSRVTDDAGHVTGISSAGSKVGGRIADAVVLMPDPMGATGGTMVNTVAAYAAADLGRPRKFISLNLIVTPEYIRRVLEQTDDVVIHAGRVDRGMSPPDVLESVPGTHLERESGLNEQSYIVPGAGGLGEVINNAWV